MSLSYRTLLLCNDKIFPVGQESTCLAEHGYSGIPSNTSHIVWIKCNNDEWLCVQDAIESCCLLKSITVVDYNGDLGTWLGTFDGIVTNLVVINEVNTSVALDMDTYQVYPLTRNRDLPLVVSSVCYGGCVLPDGIERINVCDLSTLDIQKVRALKKATPAGVDIYSVNGLFYNRKENVFHSPISFLEQFTKMIHFAGSLGAKAIIYGSSKSKYIQVSQGYQYATYKDAHHTFCKTLDILAKIAAKYGCTIYIKPNKGGNYLFDEDQVLAMVQHIDCPNVKVGPMRDGVLNRYDEFELLEWIMSPATLERMMLFLL